MTKRFRRHIPLWQDFYSLVTSGTGSLFARAYLSIFASLFIILTVYCLAHRTDFFYFFVAIVILALICLPCAFIVTFFINKTGDSLIDILYGYKRQEDHSQKLLNSEIMKLISLREKGEYEKMLEELSIIEKRYGISPRLIYERAHCFIGQGELRKARSCIKCFLSNSFSIDEDPYLNYCQQLLYNDQSPLALKNITQKNENQEF